MGVNRYDRPAQQQIIDTYAPMPYKEMLLAGQAQQQQFDKLEAERIALGDKEWDNLSPDSEAAQKEREWLTTEVDRIADMYTTNMSGAKSAIKQLERKVKKKSGKGGNWTAMQGAYDTRAAYSKAQKARIGKKNGITSDMYEKSMYEFDKNYKTQKGIGEKGEDGYQGYGTEELSKYVDYTDFANKYGKDIKSDIIAQASSKIGGDGYIRDFDRALEYMTEEEVEGILINYAKGSDELMSYLEQGSRLGYSSKESLLAAIGAGTDKYSFEKETKSASTSTDATYRWAADKADLAAANAYMHLSGAAAFVDSGDSDVSFETASKANKLQLDKGEEEVTALEEEIKGYVTYNQETGETVINPETEPAYRAAERALLVANSKVEGAQQTYGLNMETLTEAIEEVTGRDVSGKKVLSVNAQGTAIFVEDETKVIGFRDAQGNPVSLIHEGYYTDHVTNIIGTEKSNNLWAGMKENNYTPVYGVETIEYASRKGDIQKVLNKRKAKSKDHIVDYYTSSDFELSQQLEVLQEDIINNISTGFDVMVTDKNNRMVKASSKVENGFKLYASMTPALAEYKIKYDDDYSEEDKSALLSMLAITRQKEGSEEWEDKTKLVGTTRGNNGYAILKDPNGNKIALKPKASYQQTYDEMMDIADRQVYTSTGDETFKTRGYMRKYESQYNQLTSLKKELSDHKTTSASVLLNKKPIKLVDGYYFHVGRGKNENTVHVWMSKSPYKRDFPTVDDTESQEIETSRLAQVGMNNIEAILTYKGK